MFVIYQGQYCPLNDVVGVTQESQNSPMLFSSEK